MTKKYFNFNNEQDLFPIDVDEDGRVTITVDGQDADFDSVEDFAHHYAIARNVLPENLKNWTLVEDGNNVSFVLQAGTAGSNDKVEKIIEKGMAEGLTAKQIAAMVGIYDEKDDESETSDESENHDNSKDRILNLSQEYQDFDNDTVLLLKSLYDVDTLEDVLKRGYDNGLFDLKQFELDETDDEIDSLLYDANEFAQTDADELDEIPEHASAVLGVENLYDLANRYLDNLKRHSPENAPVELMVHVADNRPLENPNFEELEKTLIANKLAHRNSFQIKEYHLDENGEFKYEVDEDDNVVYDDFISRQINDFNDLEANNLFLIDGVYYYQVQD